MTIILLPCWKVMKQCLPHCHFNCKNQHSPTRLPIQMTCASGILFLYLLIAYWSCFVQFYNIIVEVTTSLRWDNSVSWDSVTIGDLMFQVPIFILNNGAWVCDYFYKPQSLLIGLIILCPWLGADNTLHKRNPHLRIPFIHLYVENRL